MDSAVVIVLMAEWALYTVLQKIGIKPDALLGCSTGEFAALTMSGAVDILTAAPMFFRLSTAVSKSVPKDDLAQLRTAMVLGDYDLIEGTLAAIENLYVGAALAPSQTIISGSQKAIDIAVAKLEELSIDSYILPMAIPYHTPLVSGFVDHDNPELQELPLQAPTTPAWSCSKVAPYPSDVSAMRRITTELFTQPILLKRTIEAMYADGITKFVEVGPRGALTPLIDEILADRPHLSVASNNAHGSAITQLNQCLGLLAAHGVPMDLGYLFARRAPELIDFDRTPKPVRAAIRLNLRYPEISLSQSAIDEVHGLDNSSSQHRINQTQEGYYGVDESDSNYGYAEDAVPQVRFGNSPELHQSKNNYDDTLRTGLDAGQHGECHPESNIGDAVVQNYLNGMAEFHRNLMGMQEQIMGAYFAQSHESQIGETPDSEPTYVKIDQEAEFYNKENYGQHINNELDITDQAIARRQQQQFSSESNQSSDFRLPLLRTGMIANEVDETNAQAEVMLSLDAHRYLLDHAIGGAVTMEGTQPERVYLLPLTVALEMMSELASVLIPHLKVVKLSEVRAFKRIRVTGEGCRLRVRATKQNQNLVTASIEVLESNSDAASTTISMQCRVHFNTHYNQSPMFAQLSSQTAKPRLKPEELYSDRAMFHGPRMQSVRELISTNKQATAAVVSARPALDWFPNTDYPHFVLDPLLLDNATQPVLFHLFEHNEDVSALLPFLVESLDIYTELGSLSGETTVYALMQSVTSRGTEADVYITDKQNHVLAKFSSITSRRIILDQAWKNFVNDPSLNFLSTSFDAELNPATASLCTTAIVKANQLPDDEATLTWCVDYILNIAERESYFGLSNLPRKKEWLAGRIAAKDAVRRLTAESGLQLCPADIIINRRESGQPFADGLWIEHLGWQPALSISHKDGVAIAVVSKHASNEMIGVDIEPIVVREDDFNNLAFSETELAPVKSLKEHVRAARLTQMWCAKESVGKALGIGLSANPKSLHATLQDNGQSSATFVVLASKLNKAFIAQTYIFSNMVCAITLLENAHADSAL